MEKAAPQFHVGLDPTDPTGPIARATAYPTVTAPPPTIPPDPTGVTPIYDALRAELTAAPERLPRADDPGERNPNPTLPAPGCPSAASAMSAEDGDQGALTPSLGGPESTRQEP